jgi:SAM-dependent methyltransferase
VTATLPAELAATLEVEGGGRIALDVERWRAEVDRAEAALLRSVPEPVLDIGCGPGRAVLAVSAEGRVALGIDPAPAAVAEAARRGASVLQRSVFGPLPGEGRWGSALLLDGNLGIGGDPVSLLPRVGELLRPDGIVVAELAPSGGRRHLVVRLRIGEVVGPRFPWATVDAATWHGTAGAAGLVGAAVLDLDGRAFGTARRPWP